MKKLLAIILFLVFSIPAHAQVNKISPGSMVISIPGGPSSALNSLLGSSFSINNNLCPIFARGDSLTSGTGGSGGYPATLKSKLKCNIYNSGIGGQTSTQIAKRQGGVAFTVTVTGNQLTAGSTSVTAIDGVSPAACNVGCVAPLSTAASNTTFVLQGTLCTKHGYLQRTASGGPPSTSETYTFVTDATSGGPFACSANSTFSPDDSNYSSSPNIIWSGRNNATDPTTVKSDIAGMVSTLTSSNYVVLSVLNASTETVGTGTYNTIIALNNDLKTTYGSKYLDVRSYLVSNYNPSIPQDVTDHSNDVVPSSLRADTIHLNQAGYDLVAQYIYNNAPFLASKYVTLGGSNSFGNYLLNLPADSGGASFAAGPGALVNQISYGVLNDTAFGYNALNNANGAVAADNSAFGTKALENLTTGNNNTVFGSWAMQSATTAGSNSVFGRFAGTAITSALNNTIVGANAAAALKNGGFNTAIGTLAYVTATVGQFNTGVGYASLNQATNSRNTAIGNSSGSKITTGASNVIVGDSVASLTLTTGSNNILIGTSSLVDTTASSQSNYINIGNALIGVAIKPSIASGFGSSPSVVSGNSTAAFTVNVGTGGTAQNGVVALGSAPTGWACNADDITTPATNSTRMISSTATTATFQNYSRTTGLAAAWAASDILAITCNGF